MAGLALKNQGEIYLVIDKATTDKPEDFDKFTKNTSATS